MGVIFSNNYPLTVNTQSDLERYSKLGKIVRLLCLHFIGKKLFVSGALSNIVRYYMKF